MTLVATTVISYTKWNSGGGRSDNKRSEVSKEETKEQIFFRKWIFE